MHHKRRRSKSRRAGCLCGNKVDKQNGFPQHVKIKGVRVARILKRDPDVAQ